MARSYNFAVIRFAPDRFRDEKLNIGVVVFKNDGLDIALGRRLEKIRAISSRIDVEDLVRAVENLVLLDAQNRESEIRTDHMRWEALARSSVFELSALGTLSASSNNDLAGNVQSLLRRLVDPEPAQVRVKHKRTRLVTTLKMDFRGRGILARADEGLESHRVVAGYEVDDGLIADFMLKNGQYHVIETVDATADAARHVRAIEQIAVSALVLARARMKFGSMTTSRLIYDASPTLEKLARPSLEAAESQGIELVNWSSRTDKDRLISTLLTLAQPVKVGNQRRHLVSSNGFFH